MNERDVHDRLWKPQVFLDLRAGRRACAGNYAVVHARRGVRSAGDIGWHNPDNRLSDLSAKTQTRSASPALQADIVLRPRPRLVARSAHTTSNRGRRWERIGAASLEKLVVLAPAIGLDRGRDDLAAGQGNEMLAGAAALQPAGMVLILGFHLRRPALDL